MIEEIKSQRKKMSIPSCAECGLDMFTERMGDKADQSCPVIKWELSKKEFPCGTHHRIVSYKCSNEHILKIEFCTVQKCVPIQVNKLKN